MKIADIPTGFTSRLVPLAFDNCVSGVYLLLYRDEVVYVGQAVDVQTRTATHRKEKRGRWTRAVYIPVARAELDDVEAALIRFFKPRLNAGAARRTTRDGQVLARFGLPGGEPAKRKVHEPAPWSAEDVETSERLAVHLRLTGLHAVAPYWQRDP